jgi:uncharacterized membrane protein YedE/YeeE
LDAGWRVIGTGTPARSSSAAPTLVAFGAGVLFALGLGMAGALHPRVIHGFLDVTGAWDPTLLVMFASALVTFGILQQVARRMRKPLLAPSFRYPTRRPIDGALVGGSAAFGIGWGLAGVCPGPALTAALWNGSIAAFTLSLAVTIAIVDRLRRRRPVEESCG